MDLVCQAPRQDTQEEVAFHQQGREAEVIIGRDENVGHHRGRCEDEMVIFEMDLFEGDGTESRESEVPDWEAIHSWQAWDEDPERGVPDWEAIQTAQTENNIVDNPLPLLESSSPRPNDEDPQIYDDSLNLGAVRWRIMCLLYAPSRRNRRCTLDEVERSLQRSGLLTQYMSRPYFIRGLLLRLGFTTSDDEVIEQTQFVEERLTFVANIRDDIEWERVAFVGGTTIGVPEIFTGPRIALNKLGNITLLHACTMGGFVPGVGYAYSDTGSLHEVQWTAMCYEWFTKLFLPNFGGDYVFVEDDFYDTLRLNPTELRASPRVVRVPRRSRCRGPLEAAWRCVRRALAKRGLHAQRTDSRAKLRALARDGVAEAVDYADDTCEWDEAWTRALRVVANERLLADWVREKEQQQ